MVTAYLSRRDWRGGFCCSSAAHCLRCTAGNTNDRCVCCGDSALPAVGSVDRKAGDTTILPRTGGAAVTEIFHDELFDHFIMSTKKKAAVPLDIAAVAAALGVSTAATPTHTKFAGSGATPKAAPLAAAAAVAAKSAPIRVKMCSGTVAACVPKFMPTDVYVQSFDKLKAVPIFRGKHVGFASLSDGVSFVSSVCVCVCVWCMMTCNLPLSC